MSETAQVTKATGIVGSATLLSRILGFIRDVVIAAYFGAGLSSDAFFVAFRIPNLLRRLVGEGSLSIAFIPVFTEYLTRCGEEEAFKMARTALRWLSLVLVVIVILGIILCPLIITVIAPGFSDTAFKFELTVNLARLVFPYIFFIALVAFCMGVLNSLGHFAGPALAPVFLNLAIILTVFVAVPFLDQPVYALAIGVLIGGFLQLILQVPFLIKKKFYFWQSCPRMHPGIKTTGKLMLPAILGAAVYQINILIGTLLASLLPEGSISYLYYADRLVQFPLGVFAIAAATAVLPSLSRQASIHDFKALGETFAHALKLMGLITIPSMIGLMVLSQPIISLLFERGAFGNTATQLTADALICYAVGLWAFASVRIVVATFYALQDTATPVRMAIYAIIFNIFMALILMEPMQHNGLALATSLASFLNLGLLLIILQHRLEKIYLKDIAVSTCKSLLCSVIMGLIVWEVRSRLAGGPLTVLLISILTGILVYAGLVLLINKKEVLTILRK